MTSKQTNAKRKVVLKRVESLRQAVAKAEEYLKSGGHADWIGFRPLFVRKFRNGEELPPHKDWVKNVFLPRNEKALRRAERLIERFVSRASCRPVRHWVEAELGFGRMQTKRKLDLSCRSIMGRSPHGLVGAKCQSFSCEIIGVLMVFNDASRVGKRNVPLRL